jgi:hypothetical protein
MILAGLDQKNLGEPKKISLVITTKYFVASIATELLGCSRQIFGQINQTFFKHAATQQLANSGPTPRYS